MTRESAGWVYAVVSDQVGEVPPDATTWTGEPVRLVRGSGLAAVVGSLPPDLTGEEQLQEHLCDPAWLERTIRAHHHVVTSFFRRTPTVPFRMGTVCRGDDRVRDLLAAQADGLRAALATVAGRAEWGVQVYPGTAAGETAAAAGPAPAAAGARAADPARPGTSYLLRRRAERQRREQVRPPRRPPPGTGPRPGGSVAVTGRPGGQRQDQATRCSGVVSGRPGPRW